ncbi:UDP-N-acetylglucosamine 1-carboxyvinyltransferase [Natranaerovirga pectinivora]|uniref:UDP-N-acetylglucosamine 1-carboxyvinyltransferase n=1 Tax=Natranaerovirga pectinivora TaxID=682400 RepID=A0A4R3MJY6_9FIRM|nr:UDP-N-acetylglucosamine 1-carboxyvinyltransferase [Natranaerovirga pectinivora]TCT12950.1 UDP-N-acetylglucosamine 1-carboxyvinyltransferase [Natranaerovirga pectinivora]
MEQLIIRGKKPLTGEVYINGAKNAALGVLAAAILSDEDCIIENIPNVNDINVLLQAISKTGAKVEKMKNHKVKINGKGVSSFSIDYESIKKIRASYYLLGALLGKYKKAEVALPGGCNIGNRPIDQHIKGFEALGATVKVEHGMIIAEAKELKGANIYLDVVSVGATINIMLAAILANGTTIIENSAKEPHIVDVANFLNSMGADIKGAGTDVIKINGVEKLHKTEYMIIPDQIEAGTFMLAAAITGGDVTVKSIIPKHMEAISAKLQEMGVTIEEQDEAIRVIAKEPLKSTHVKTLPYPGFPTDMQPQMTAVLCTANGTSVMTESIFENRFRYIDELSRMGANVKVEGNTAIIDGINSYSGAEVSAPDLRAGAALILAGLAADGITIINQLEYIDRGYENIEDKFIAIGADIARVSNEKEIKKFKLKTCS